MVNNKVKKKLIKTGQPFNLFVFGSLLSACNSGGDSIIGPVTTTSLTGAVIKGPLQGALVYADSDGDGIGDGDPIMTGSDGSYTISATNANATIIAITSDDTVDTSSGEILSGVTLKAPAGSSVVTPATTILEAQPDLEPAQLAVALGIPTTAADGSAIDLMSFNPYSADADPAAALAAEKAAQQVMVTIKAVSAAAEGAGMDASDAFESAMASVAEVVSEVAEKIDVSSDDAIKEAEQSISSGTTQKMDFSNTEVLKEISSTVQTKVIEAAALDESIEIDQTAFSSVLETAIISVENVNAKIDLVEDLTSEESMGIFATVTDMASEVKAAAESEVLSPGSGAEIMTFTDVSKVEDAAAEAASKVTEKLIAAAEKFEQIYDDFLEEFPVVDLESGNPDASVDDNETPQTEVDPEDALNTTPDIEDPAEIATDDKGSDDTNSPGSGVGIIFVPSGPSVDNTIYKFFTTKVSTLTDESIVLDFYVDMTTARSKNATFSELTGYQLAVNTKNGWATDTEAMSGNTAFSWTNDVGLVDGSKTTGAISTNNSLSNSTVGGIALVSGSDFSNSINEVKLGSMSFDPVDGQSSFSLTVSGTLTDGSSQLITQNQYILELF